MRALQLPSSASHCGRTGSKRGLQSAVRSTQQLGLPRPCAPLQALAPSTPSSSAYGDPQSPLKVVTQDVLDDFMTGLTTSQLYEYDYWVDEGCVEGTIPKELSGTYFKNGPGLFEIGGHRIDQVFDGDGMVCSFAFRNGNVFFRNRYVRTKGFLEEQAAGRQLYQGAFASGDGSLKLRNPADLNVKNVANTGVVYWGGRLLALHETGLPHELHPLTLDTLGETHLDGSIQGTGPFHAHYRVVEEPDGSERLVGFGVALAGLDGVATFYEYNQDGSLACKSEAHLPLGGFGFYHDMVTTRDYYVLVENSIRLNFMRLLTKFTIGLSSIAACLDFRPEIPVKIHCIPRPGKGGDRVHTIETPPGVSFFSFHHANAFQSGARLVLDTVALDRVDLGMTAAELEPEYYDGGSRSHLCRLVLDLDSDKLVDMARLSNRTGEFPSVNPEAAGRPHRYSYMAVSDYDDPRLWGPNRGLMKVTHDPDAGVTRPISQAGQAVECFMPGPRKFTQECTFVPREGGTAEDDGWLLTLVHDAETMRAQLYIIDAAKFTAGPVAVITLPHHIPNGLHGSWCDRYWGPGQAAPKGWSASSSTPTNRINV